MRVGLALPHYDFSFPDRAVADPAASVSWAVRAESLGFASVWVSDHFFLDISRYGGPPGRQGSLEPFVTLAAVATATSRVRLGTLVLCEAFRSPLMMAKQAATLDLLSGGRLDVGLGAGWYEDEYAAAGEPFGASGERMTRLRETLTIAGALLQGETLTFEGEHYSVRDAALLPPPAQMPRPALWVGSKGGPRAARITAEAADGWNTVWRFSLDEYRAKAQILDAACAESGRSVRRSIGLYTLVGDDLPKTWERLQAWAPNGMLDAVTLEQFADGGLCGTAEQCAERLAGFAALGVEEVIVAPAPLPFAVPLPEQLDVIAETLIPLVAEL